uniref:Uncharacterized protein n=1 Tax=Eutreptiella gymnastica TaxID=73025 RepID=A0A6T2FME0_9EUGL
MDAVDDMNGTPTHGQDRERGKRVTEEDQPPSLIAITAMHPAATTRGRPSPTDPHGKVTQLQEVCRFAERSAGKRGSCRCLRLAWATPWRDEIASIGTMVIRLAGITLYAPQHPYR